MMVRDSLTQMYLKCQKVALCRQKNVTEVLLGLFIGAFISK